MATRSNMIPPRHDTEMPGRTNAYKNQAMQQLKFTFRRLSVEAIQLSFENSKFHFTSAFRILSTVNASEHEDQVDQRVRILNNAPFLVSVDRVFLKGPRKIKPSRIVDKTLMEEVDAIPELNCKENRQQQQQTQIQEALDKKQKEQPPVPGLECGCCYGEFAFEELGQCEDAHLFCKACIKAHVTEQIFGLDKSEFHCMSMEGCLLGFPSNTMKLAFPKEKERQKIEQHLFRASIEQANMKDLCQCPKCDYQFILPEGYPYNVLNCPERKCKHAFCRMCKEAPHKSKTCQEAKNEKLGDNARARAAEAMTEAVVRHCPRCNKPFFKEEGCNRMKCPCGAVSCYVCRKELVGERRETYAHFCPTPHCTHESCGRCILFTDTVEDNRRSRREAGLKEQENAGVAAALAVGMLLTPPQKMNGVARRPLEPIPYHPAVNNLRGILRHPHADGAGPAAALLEAPPAVDNQRFDSPRQRQRRIVVGVFRVRREVVNHRRQMRLDNEQPRDAPAQQEGANIPDEPLEPVPNHPAANQLRGILRSPHAAGPTAPLEVPPAVGNQRAGSPRRRQERLDNEQPRVAPADIINNGCIIL